MGAKVEVVPNRIIKESIWTSPNLNNLSDLAERHFYRILPLPDDHGCCELTPRVVKGRCYPHKDKVTFEDIDNWQQELEENKIIVRWELNGRQYGIFPTFSKHQHIRSLHLRKTPVPPTDIQEKCDTIGALSEDNRTSRRMIADDNAHQQVAAETEEDPLILQGLLLSTGLHKLKMGGLSKTNERLFRAELKKRGLEGLLDEK